MDLLPSDIPDLGKMAGHFQNSRFFDIGGTGSWLPSQGPDLRMEGFAFKDSRLFDNEGTTRNHGLVLINEQSCFDKYPNS